MKNLRIFAGIFILALSLVAAPGRAQETAFSYQGLLQYNGVTTAGSYDLIFTLYATNQTGLVIAGPVTNSAVTVTNGLFTTLVDFGPGAFNGTAGWLEIAISTNAADDFTTLTPRQELTPVPSALFATTASNLLGSVTSSQISGGIPAETIVGVLATTQLPDNVLTNGAAAVTLTGALNGNATSATTAGLASNVVAGITLNGTYITNAFITNSVFAGNGGGLTNLNASQLTSGTVPLAQLSGITSNQLVAMTWQLATNLNGGYAALATNVVSGIAITNAFITNSIFAGDGSGLTNLNYGNIANPPVIPATNGFVTAAITNGLAAVSFVTGQGYVTNGAGNVSLTGTFTGSGTGLTNVNLLNLNTDGALSWVTNPPATNYSNLGFVTAGTYSVGSSPYSVCAADVNGDGKPDLISANYSGNTLTVLTNNGTGGFVTAGTYSVGSSPFSVCAADVNGDGKVDLISANGDGNSLTVLTNSLAGTLAPTSYTASYTGNGAGLTNLNASQLSSGTVPLAQLSGITSNQLVATTWQLATNLNGGYAALATNVVSGIAITNAFITNSVFAGNGGGLNNVNLLTANTAGVFTWATNTTGTFLWSATLPTGGQPWGLAAADVNGDGAVDLISANANTGTLTVLTNNGTGSFTLAATVPTGSGPDGVAAADVLRNGLVDLISANSGNNTLTVLTNNGHGGFGLAVTLPAGAAPAAVTAADVNGDGFVDLISANQNDNTLTVLTNNGHGGFGLAATLAAGSSPLAVAVADVNGDGRPDLISANSGGNTLSVFTNNGAGGFGLASSPTVGSGPFEVVAADVNGDGHVDLISANNNANTLTVLTNNGSGGFVLAATLPTGRGPYGLVAADVNGDGKPDLVCANNNDNTLTVLTNNGTGGFALAATLATGRSPVLVAAADVSGDGHVDLISANISSDTLTVLTNVPFYTGTLNGLATSAINAISATTAGVASNVVAGININGAVITNSVFAGNGGGLTNLNASQLTSGTVPLAQLSGITSNQLAVTTWQLATNLNGGYAALATNVVSGIAITNAFITNSVFAGDGSGLTNLSATSITGGVTTNIVISSSSSHTFYITNGIIMKVQ